jgi:hypothetical protein
MGFGYAESRKTTKFIDHFTDLRRYFFLKKSEYICKIGVGSCAGKKLVLPN